MEQQLYTISDFKKEAEDVFVVQAKIDQGEIFSFLPGQFARIDIPDSPSVRGHFFSIASSPTNKEYLEFGFKIYGEWTRNLSKKTIGDKLSITGSYGKFIWDGSLSKAVFLAGGIGITPFMSILRFIQANQQKPSINLIYGNRTEKHIAFRQELESIINSLPNSKVLHVLSDIQPSDVWNGYRGFITKEILEREVQFSNNLTFFVCGPPIFVQLTKDLLKSFSIDEQNIKQELF